MSRSTSVNYTTPAENFGYANAGTDQFNRGDVQKLALAFENQDHTYGRGLPVARAKWALVTKTANYTLTISEQVCLVDASGGAVTITLPSPPTVASAAAAWQVFIKKIDTSANAVTIAPSNAEKIEFVAASMALNNQGVSVLLFTNSTDWFVV